MIFVFLLLISLLVLSFMCSKNNIFSPGVITSGIWIICFLLFWILPHSLPPLRTQFLFSISLWATLLTVSALLVQSLFIKKSLLQAEPSVFIRNIYFWLSVATFPHLVLFAIEAIATGTTGNWAMDLRMAALGQTANTDGAYAGFHLLIWQVAFIIEFFYFSRKNWWKVLILGVIVLSLGMLTMAKITFLNMFLWIVFILYFKNKINLKQILIGGGALFFVFVFLQVVRHNIEMDTEDKAGFLIMYVVGNMSSFDTLIPASSQHWGENVFRLYYSVMYRFGLSDIPPTDAILPFISEPLATNTFSGMYPFFKDFGYWGVGIFAGVLGLIFGWIFRRAQQGDAMYILIYTVLLPAIFMQYVAEQFFTNITTYMYQMVLIGIPFVFSKYKLLQKK